MFISIANHAQIVFFFERKISECLFLVYEKKENVTLKTNENNSYIKEDEYSLHIVHLRMADGHSLFMLFVIIFFEALI